MDAVVRIGADVQQALRGIDQLNRRLDNVQRASVRSAASMKALEGAASRVSTALTAAATAFVGFAATRGLQGILEATQRMEGFRTQLTTYLGSQQLANAELKRLSDLAKTLPQDVDELTQAFVIFQRFGIDTSNESMRAFSNIAAANSKSIIQFGEAVADALTGEFERLKEFGIKVSTENGKYTARIGEDQVAVATSTSQLVEQLKQLGVEGGRFGSTTVGPLTMALSNFRGAIFETSAALGSGGLGLAIADTVNQLTELLTKNDEVTTAIGDGLTRAFLYAVEVSKIFFNNIELIAKAFGILLAIKVTTWVYGAVAAFGAFAVSIGRALLPALVLLGKALKATAILALRHPLIGAVAVIVGGIEYLTGAVSALAEEMGLIGDDSMLDGLLQDARGLADEITGPIVDGMEQFSSIGARVDEQFNSIKERSQQTTQALSESAAAAERHRLAEEAKARAAEQAAAAFANLLKDSQDQLDLSLKTKEQQELINLEKEYEKKLGRDITQEEREKLAVYIQQRQQVERIVQQQQRLNESLNALTLENFQQNINALNEAYRNLGGTVDERNQELINQEANRFDRMIQLETAYQNLSYQMYQDWLSKKEEALAVSLERQVIQEKKAINDVLTERNREFLQRQGQNERQRTIIRDRIEFEKKSEAEKAQFAISQGAEIFNQLGTYNKKAFEAAKAFNIANAVMNTYMGATKALATYPPPFNFIAAAAVVAAGLAQVASIRSQSYSGRQLGGPVMNGTSYIVGENGPEMFTPTTNGRIIRNGDLNTGGPVNINFNITANDATGFDDLLLQRKGMITQMISDAMVDRGQRSIL